jgi:hypothetical protein
VRFRGALIVASLLLGGCAKPDFPPGGPIDTTPPRVLATSPADSTVRVPPDAGIEILFSEPMDRISVRDGFRIFPPPGSPSFHWTGRKLKVSWAEPLKEHTTYQAFLSAGARDLHAVTLGVSHTIRFATGDSLDPGKIRGVLRARTLPTRGVPIWAYPDSLGLRPDFTNELPSYVTETDTIGAYALSGLPLGHAFTVHAAYDMNRSGGIDSVTDVVASYGSVIRLTPERPVADSINIVAVNPQAPVTVSGTVFAADSTARYRIEARSDSDTTFVRFIERKGPGDYLLRLPPGRYRLRAVRMAKTSGGPTVEVRRGEVLITRPEEAYEHVDFRFEGAPPPPR